MEWTLLASGVTTPEADMITKMGSIVSRATAYRGSADIGGLSNPNMHAQGYSTVTPTGPPGRTYRHGAHGSPGLRRFSFFVWSQNLFMDGGVMETDVG